MLCFPQYEDREMSSRVSVSVCPAGEADGDGGVEAAAAGGGETEGGAQRRHGETPTGNRRNSVGMDMRMWRK